jgi:hypothetical protein
MDRLEMLPMLKHQLWRRTRDAYYAFALDQLPLGATLGRFVSAWETAQNLGDSPKAKSTWDAEYSAGCWAYMAQHHELTL